MWTGRSQQLSFKLSVTESMFFMQEEGAWGQSVSRTCLRVSGMWHRGILRLKLRHSAGTSGTAHTPSVHEVPDLACSNTEEQNRDTNAQMSSYSWVFHGYDPLLTSAISHRLPLCHIILWFLYNVLHILRLLLYISLIKISKGVSWGGSGIWLGCLLGKHVLLKGGPEVDLGFTSLGWPGNTDTPTGFLLFGVLIFLNCFECPNKKILMVRGVFFYIRKAAQPQLSLWCTHI